MQQLGFQGFQVFRSPNDNDTHVMQAASSPDAPNQKSSADSLHSVYGA